MAYAALVSLSQTLQQIMQHHRYRCIRLVEEQQLEPFQEKLSFLQAFLEDYSQIGGETVEGLEGRMRDVAYRAEDIVESHVSDQISSQDDRYGVKKDLKQLISTIQKAAYSLNSCKRCMKLELQNIRDLQLVMLRATKLKICKPVTLMLRLHQGAYQMMGTRRWDLTRISWS
ncbi:UNVERIFIED_CONTAM: hypothetical protein Slati_0299000 [Sesamum latifolium]|uniref:Rx N-terminal domain-containing protein n=1 Tax=Sesamum latifolium TaxID=2727402 RepID=A0AAW2YEV1_9LAMI